MKKFIFISLSIIFILFSCKDDSKKTNSDSSNYSETIIQTDDSITQVEADNSIQVTNSAPQKIDLDLTAMSKTMIYSTVFDMVACPEDYLGKVVRVKGNFWVFEDELNPGERYFAIIIPDATACCQQGMEFIWEGNHIYPDDYPLVGNEATITGKYEMMELEDEISYFYLRVSDVEF